MNISQVLTKLKTLIYSKSETDSLLGGKANSSHTHTKSQITDFPSLATVATSGSYSDLSNKPTIPSKTSQLTNDSDFLSTSTGIKVTRGSSVSTGRSGYWAAMCNSSQNGSPTLPTTDQWWHVLNMDWSDDITNWHSQLALPTQQNSCLYWRRNNSGGTSIDSSTWHKVIDDTNIGSQSVNYANSAAYAGYVQGTRTFSTYVNAVKYGNAFVSSNQTGFSTIWNAPTKNYRVGCAVYTNENDDVYLCYSVSNANVNSSTNTVTRDCVWNAGDGTLRSANIKATSGLYYNSYRIYVG